MVKANIMPIFNSDMTILLELYSFLYFWIFFDQKICTVKKNHLHKSWVCHLLNALQLHRMVDCNHRSLMISYSLLVSNRIIDILYNLNKYV